MSLPAEIFAVASLDSKELSSEELAAKCREGCRDSFALLVEKFEARVFSYLCRFVGNEHDAEDLTQDTFVSAFRNIHRYEPRYAFSTWIFTIAKRAALSHFRSRQTARRILEEEFVPEKEIDADDPAVLLEQKDGQSQIWNAAKGLKPKHHEALWLRYGEGFSVAETAQIMGASQIYVKVLIHRGRGELAKILARREKLSADART